MLRRPLFADVAPFKRATKGMTVRMTRSDAREIAVRLCFELSATAKEPDEILERMFNKEYYKTLDTEDELFASFPNESQKKYIENVIHGIGEHNAELDSYIEKYAKGWKFERISRTALAIMKTAMFEILYMPDIPNKVSINEAVELAKAYEEPETIPFVNGVLGSFVRGEAVEL